MVLNGDDVVTISEQHVAPSSADRPEAGAIHLRAGGTSLVIDASPDPVIIYWGADLGDVTDDELASLVAVDQPQRVSGSLDRGIRHGVLATASSGWIGTPAIEGHRSGAAFALHLTTTDVHVDARSVTIDVADRESGLSGRIEFRVSESGLVRQRFRLVNDDETPFTLNAVTLGFPVPWEATELLDTSGRHLRERSPQRHEFTFGTHLRESRKGRPGADGTLLYAAGRPGFGWEDGLVHAIHVAWSGNQRVLAERTTNGNAFLAGGELYGPGEVILDYGDELTTPWVLGSWGDGLNELSHRFHDDWRARPAHPSRPRPVTLNTWEAVYFDHDLGRLTSLADAAAAVGVERFVLDDGWFLGRRDDTAGLGDWRVDRAVWPEGLHPLVDHVLGLGMEFGLWVEPEMVNPDSELARAHPEWLLRGRAELPPSARQQQVLNLAIPEAYNEIRSALLALLDEYPIAYLKWDHNRDLLDAGSGPGGQTAVREHTLAVYRLIDDLKRAHPGLEIENCASGGSRVDLGILDRTDRVWTSDCLDPVERLVTQRYTGIVVPPEMLGMHLTTPHVHSTGRTVSLTMSGATALFGHFGIEWDLTTLTDAERDDVAAWVALAKRVREVVATGHIEHSDTAEPGIDVRTIVSADRGHAFATIAQTETLVSSPSGRVRFRGLDPERRYSVRVCTPGGVVQEPAQSALVWAHQDTTLTGRQLATVGIRPPVQNPQQATVIEFQS